MKQSEAREAAFDIECALAQCVLPCGSDLREDYAKALLAEVLGLKNYEITTAGNNNWISHRFQTHDLFAIVYASPIHRLIAALFTVEKWYKHPVQKTPDLAALRDRILSIMVEIDKEA